ncbi:MAG: hypothetical protein E7381_01610 [Clostridiales bacterium]|nr:hypothetical protein [Clostridiales bacterium]
MKKYKFSTLNQTKLMIVVSAILLMFVALFIIINKAVSVYLNSSLWIGYAILLFYGIGGGIYVFCLIKKLWHIPYIVVTEDSIVKMKGKKVFAKIEFQNIIDIQKIDESTSLVKYTIITQDKKEELSIPFSLHERFETMINQWITGEF